MIVLTIVLAIAGLLVGGGGATVVNRKLNARSADESKKELAKAKKEAEAMIKKAEEANPSSVPSASFPEPASLDMILKMQMSGLTKLTKLIVSDIYALNITKDTPQQLATCFKITFELKKAEKDLIDELSEEELEKFANDNE